MPLALLKHGFRRNGPPPRILPAAKPLARNYDVIIIGGGGHGLATAYYLARDHDIRSVAVLEKGYLAGGNTARNTAIVRSNYLTPEGVEFAYVRPHQAEPGQAIAIRVERGKMVTARVVALPFYDPDNQRQQA
jgi:glycine/D-amino acid oxidase-like deaminating enzyme